MGEIYSAPGGMRGHVQRKKSVWGLMRQFDRINTNLIRSGQDNSARARRVRATYDRYIANLAVAGGGTRMDTDARTILANDDALSRNMWTPRSRRTYMR